MRFLFLLLVLILPAFSRVVAETTPPEPATTNALRILQPEAHYGDIVRLLADRLPREHLMRYPLDDMMSARIWTNYIAALDVERSFFLASDIEAFRSREHALDDELREGKLDFALHVFHVYRQRVHERYAAVGQLLQKDNDFSLDETYRWQRKDAPWPRDTADMDELWRKRIKNEYLRELIATEIGQDTNASPTNAVSPVTVATNAVATNAAPASIQSPRASILNRYRQFVTILDDSDAQWVLERYLSAFTHAYDPHSDYFSPSGTKDFEIEMKLSLVGIGAMLRSEDGTAKVMQLVPGGPADQDKRDIRLQPGDKIIAVGQDREPPVDVMHWPLHKVVERIRGKKGTRVVLVVVPASDTTGSTTKRVDLIRDEVKLEEQEASAKVREVKDSESRARRLAIITLPTFYANMKASSPSDPDYKSSTEDVARLLTGLATQNLDGVVLDLRNNGGGSLLEAITMTGLFIRTGPVVQVKERWRVRTLNDSDPRRPYGGPLVVLVNRLSASASEILAGALQDYGRAVIIGDAQTHGKGSVQSLLELDGSPDLGSAKITTANYYRITGSSTQMKGVTPDIVLSSPFQFMGLGEDALPYAIAWSEIPAAAYAPIADLAPAITELRAQSERRQAEEPHYLAYQKLLHRIAEMQKMEEIQLNIDKRREMARAEKEISKLQDDLMPDSPTPADPDKKKELPDPVMDEALRILADFVAMPAKTPAPRDTVDRKPASYGLFDWLMEKM